MFLNGESVSHFKREVLQKTYIRGVGLQHLQSFSEDDQRVLLWRIFEKDEDRSLSDFNICSHHLQIHFNRSSIDSLAVTTLQESTG